MRALSSVLMAPALAAMVLLHLVPASASAQLRARATTARDFVAEAASTGVTAEAVVQELTETYQEDEESIATLMAEARFEPEAVVRGFQAVGKPAETVGRAVGDAFRMTDRVDEYLFAAGYGVRDVGAFYRDVRGVTRDVVERRITEITGMDPLQVRTEIGDIGLRVAPPTVTNCCMDVSGLDLPDPMDGSKWVRDPGISTGSSSVVLNITGTGLDDDQLSVRIEGQGSAEGQVSDAGWYAPGIDFVTVRFDAVPGNELVITNSGGEVRIPIRPYGVRLVAARAVSRWFSAAGLPEIRVAGGEPPQIEATFGGNGISQLPELPPLEGLAVIRHATPVERARLSLTGGDGMSDNVEVTPIGSDELQVTVSLRSREREWFSVREPLTGEWGTRTDETGETRLRREVVKMVRLDDFRFTVTTRVNLAGPQPVFSLMDGDMQFGMAYDGLPQNAQTLSQWLNVDVRNAMWEAMVQAAQGSQINPFIAEDLGLNDGWEVHSVQQDGTNANVILVRGN